MEVWRKGVNPIVKRRIIIAEISDLACQYFKKLRAFYHNNKYLKIDIIDQHYATF